MTPSISSPAVSPSCDKINVEVDARGIKERFESGALFDENTPPRRRDVDDTELFAEGTGFVLDLAGCSGRYLLLARS